MAEDRREQILEVATAEFAEYEYDDASLNRIIESAGLSKGSMYYYFENKADLFLEVVARAMAPLTEIPNKLDEVNDREAYWSEIKKLLRAVIKLGNADPETAGIVRSMYALGGREKMTGIREFDRAWRAWVSRVLDIGQAVGAVREDVSNELLEIAANGVITSIDQWLAMHWEDLSAVDVRTATNESLVLMRSLVEPPDGRGG